MNAKLVELKTRLRLLPFGHAVVEVQGGGEAQEAKKERTPVYAEPGTTNTGTQDITFDGENYAVPKTTGGLL